MKRQFWIGLLLGVLLPLVGAFLFFATGSMPVATKGPPLPFERQIAHIALDAAIGDSAKTPSPVQPDEANLLAGAKTYRKNCAVCHGEPGVAASAIAKGMFPMPPALFEKKGVTDDEVGETFWKVKNGIRLTGMPGFESTLTETEMWQVSLLLLKAHELPSAVTTALSSP
jgi:thiosulfate dehydrogenase